MVKDPFFCTVDFKDAWAAGIKAVFPLAVVIICHFHVVQLLVRALISEFERVKHEKFGKFISECNDARKKSLSAENGDPVPGNPGYAHSFVAGWYEFQEKISALGEVREPEPFTVGLESLFHELHAWDAGIEENLTTLLQKKRPKRGFTTKSIKYFKEELNKKWRGVLRIFRKDLEEEKRQFHHVKYLLLKNPGNLACFEEELMAAYINKNPWTLPYRIGIVKFYWMLDNPWKHGTSFKFLRQLIVPQSHKSLKAALNTLETRREEIFNFMKVIERYPSMVNYPAFRQNPEPTMKKVNNISRAQYGLRSDESAALRVGHLLNCPVVISQEVLGLREVDLT